MRGYRAVSIPIFTVEAIEARQSRFVDARDGKATSPLSTCDSAAPRMAGRHGAVPHADQLVATITPAEPRPEHAREVGGQWCDVPRHLLAARRNLHTHDLGRHGRRPCCRRLGIPSRLILIPCRSSRSARNRPPLTPTVERSGGDIQVWSIPRGCQGICAGRMRSLSGRASNGPFFKYRSNTAGFVTRG